MAELQIPWAPRLVLTGRSFRLPVQAPGREHSLSSPGLAALDSRFVPRDDATYHYLKAPGDPGDYTIRATAQGDEAVRTVQVRTLEQLRTPHDHNGVKWPRRWPVGGAYVSTKVRQTVQDMAGSVAQNRDMVNWWTSQSDDVLWAQLPPSELPKAHYVNVHNGCPECGTAIYRYGGFYPWSRNHQPCDFRSACPACNAVFPSNDVRAEDFTSGDFPDDGYGHFDADGNIFIFVASYHRDQTWAYVSAIEALAARLAAEGPDPSMARQLGLMLLRYASEECYVAAAPQFRFGAQIGGTEEPWDWGQPDWAAMPDPVSALMRKGTQFYAITTPRASRMLAFAYDTVWPFLKEDWELVARAQAQGLTVSSPDDTVQLVEEMLSILLQNVLDWGATSNRPNESLAVMTLLRCLDRPDAQDVMDWVYDEGPDTLRVFTGNDFLPDGSPPESTGGYNGIHTNGLLNLEYHLRQLRLQRPGEYPEGRYPSLMDEPRARRLIRQPHEVTMVGKTFFQFGDGSAPGTSAQHGGKDSRQSRSIKLEEDCFHAPLSPEALGWAADFTGDATTREIRDATAEGRHRRIGTTILDSTGIAILRTGEVPERTAVGVVFGDTEGHRHRDLLDVQLLAYGRPFLTDLGYPQSWASRALWEDHWATHNTVWGDLDREGVPGIAGRGRLRRCLFGEGIQLVDVSADRWALDSRLKRWVKLDVHFRRLIGLVELAGGGVALVDLARISGGIRHWRTCRGLEGTFSAEQLDLSRRAGTVGDPKSARGELGGLAHGDHAALAYMDDVAESSVAGAWHGSWQSRIEPAVHLDVHQIQASEGTDVLTARSTAMMGKPSESAYEFRTVVWRREPDDSDETTSVDLVFEPRVGDPALLRATAVNTSIDGAVGVALEDRDGRKTSVYWSPYTGATDAVDFDDGVQMVGPLAAIRNGKVLSVGCSSFVTPGGRHAFEGSVQQGTILGLDREACTVDVEGLVGIAAGDRVWINPEGRGHTYSVERVGDLGNGGLRLTLDVVSVLGKGKVVDSGKGGILIGVASDGDRPFRLHLPSRTGNLHGTRVETADGSAWAEVASARHAGSDRTVLQLSEEAGNPGAIRRLDTGVWVQVVDYVVGDQAGFEPLQVANIQ